MLRLQQYDLTVKYKDGKNIPVGDALSRAVRPDPDEPEFPPVTVNTVDFIAVSPKRYRQFQDCTLHGLHELHQVILKGWPDTRKEAPHGVREYWNFQDELGVADGIILKGMRIVVPPSLHQEMPTEIHETHMGITKCTERAREALFWSGMTTDIENTVNDCT